MNWYGIYKLTEECGEVLQLLGKAGPFPEAPHPDGKGYIKDRIPDELADVLAAVNYFVIANKLDQEYILKRSNEKLHKFIHWGLDGIRK